MATRLCLVMIARDEARTIARALRSAAPAVERMIVLDTGSTDGTPDIAAQCGADVLHLPWPDDFAAARNASLSHSDADWNLILDADEWLVGDLSDLGPGSLPPGADPPFVGRVPIQHFHEDGGHTLAWTARVLPRGVRYEGRIHEQPVSNLPERRLNITFGHDGFLADARERKGDRNEALLLAEIERNPDDGYLWAQLAREYWVRKKPQQACLCFANALNITPPDAGWRHGLVVRAITAFKEDGRLDEAAALADAEFSLWPQSPDFFYVVGDLYLELAVQSPDRALADFLPVAEFAWKKCLEIGERPDLDGSVAGRGSYMAAHNLAVCYGALGQGELVARYTAMAEALKAKRP